MHASLVGGRTFTESDCARSDRRDSSSSPAMPPHGRRLGNCSAQSDRLTPAAINSERTLTELDFARLRKMGRDLPAALTNVLEVADTFASCDIPADVVTMYSTVEVEDLHTRRRQKLTLCYPRDAEPSLGFVSVLSPVGSSLLGLKAGSVARWQTPSGEEGAAEVVSIPFQPEASGDYSI